MKVKQEVDCRLVLCGSMASDDPEGRASTSRSRRRREPYIDSGDLVLIQFESNILVNALQRSATVVLQKSTREGFGLTVTEGLWKGKPVVATKVGGIPMQITDGRRRLPGGRLPRVRRLRQGVAGGPRPLGTRGGERPPQGAGRFLSTRHVGDYLDLFHALQSNA